MLSRPSFSLSFSALILTAFFLPKTVDAQVFQSVPALSFTKVFAGADPLPQVITIARVGVAFNYTVAASTSSGGSWLSVTTGNGCGLCATPSPVIVSANPLITLAPGTYAGQVVATSQSGTVTLTIPVSLIVATAGTTFIDTLQGQMSFSLKTSRTTATSQDIQVRNGGTGTLNWSLTKSTADGADWITVSSTSGTAPNVVTVGINVANLPGAGITQGTFVGQLVFSGSGTVVTVPVAVVVGDAILSQVNAISFTRVFGGQDPLSQVLTIASTGAAFNYTISTAGTKTSTGGAWLGATTDSGCGLCVAPSMVTAAINSSPTLAVGTYTGQIVIVPQGGLMAITIPVTLTVAPVGSTFLDNFTGQMSFAMKTSGTSITTQDIQVRNAGTGTLNWTVSGSTSDGGNWLTISSSSGTAPAFVTIGVTVANLPSGGLIAGTFVGELVFQTAGSAVTVPISVTVGDNVFSQVNSISFTKVFGGANPLPQTIVIPSTGTNFNYVITSSTATGGAWLTATTATGCGLCVTPSTVIATIVASPTLAVGTYTGEIVVTSQGGTLGETISVTLTVALAGTAYFDNIPGQLSFSLKTASTTDPPAQQLQIRNAGTGNLDWTLIPTTSDGGNWLNVAGGLSGTAPSVLTISIVKGNLPGLGLIAGTFVGNLEFHSSTGGSVTVSISATVGDNVISQVNPIHFIKIFGGANPIPQNITIASTGTNFNFTETSSTATGGAWLTATTGTSCGLCAMPSTIVATVNASTLAVGTYTGQIVVTSQGATLAITVPVTLTVVAPAATFFDDLPGQVSFSLVTASGNPPTQDLQIRNGGTGNVGWTLAPTTSDGGNWLTVAPALSGTAPSTATIGINVANLPGLGLIAGTFVGNLMFQSASANVTVPVVVTVGANVFVQQTPLVFTKPYGGSNPVSQTANIASSATNFNFTSTFATANGGTWLNAVNVGNCGLCATPHGITASIVASPTLAAGIYTGQIVTLLQSGLESMTIPVYLSVTVALGTPTVIAPANGAAGVPLAQALSWNAASNALSYDVYFGTVNPPPLVTNTTNTSYSPGTLAFGTTYYWQIVARNGGVTASTPVVSFQTPASGAQPISVIPATGNAGRQLFNFVTRDIQGANNIQYVQFLFSKSGLTALNGCYISYDPVANVFYLLSDDLTQWYGLLGGSPNTVGNAQCTIYGATSGSVKSGNDLTTSVDMSFRSGFSGLKGINQFAGDVMGPTSGWVPVGSWNDTGDPSATELISWSPNSGTGTTQTFTAVVRDGDGANTIQFAELVITGQPVNSFSGNGCFIFFAPAANVFFLLNDSATAFLGLVAGSGSVSNSQCTLTGTGSGGSMLGSNLTVTYNLTFKPGFTGTKQVYMQAADNPGVIEIWHLMGTWTH